MRVSSPSAGTIWTIITCVVGLAFYSGVTWYTGTKSTATGAKQWVMIDGLKDKVSEHNVSILNNKEDILELKGLIISSSKDRSDLSKTLSGLVEVMKASNERADRERQERMEDEHFKKEMSKDINDIKVQMASMNARLPKG